MDESGLAFPPSDTDVVVAALVTLFLSLADMLAVGSVGSGRLGLRPALGGGNGLPVRKLLRNK